MKELSQYRDEIFRRSDEKKRQIKKRRRIALSVGIPLCLCCVLTVALFPLTKGDFAPKMEAACDNAVFEDVETTMQSFRVTDRSQVNQVLSLLDGGFLLQKDEDENDAVADRVPPGSYRLTLELPDGSTLVYQIEDDHAYCETTGETVTLSTNQVEAIYELVSQNR